jgi:hypothetical protein
MKRLFFYSLVFTLFFSLAGVSDLSARHRVKPRYKKVVVVKPVKPHIYVNRHVHVRSGYMWIDGHWKFNKRTRNYVWVNGDVVKKKRNKVWVSGRWSKVRGGWIYNPGFWA